MTPSCWLIQLWLVNLVPLCAEVQKMEGDSLRVELLM